MNLGILGVLDHPLVQGYQASLEILKGQAGLSDQGFQEILESLIHPLAQELPVLQILVSQDHLWVQGTLVFLGNQTGQVGLIGRGFLSLQELLVIPSPPCYPSVLGLLETLEFLEYQDHLWGLKVPVDLAFHLAQGNQDLQGYREYPLLLVVR